MDMPGSGYLFNLSIIAATFVGFSAIVVILRQSLGNPFQPLDSLASRLFMTWGFVLAFVLAEFSMRINLGAHADPVLTRDSTPNGWSNQ